MSIKENKDLVRHVYELWNRRDLKAFFELLSDDYIEHLPDGDMPFEQLENYAHTFFAAFPDIRFSIKDMIAERDRVVVLVNWKGTHKGAYSGISPTGRCIDITVVNIIRIANGKWVEFWNLTDRLSLMQQLGAIPS